MKKTLTTQQLIDRAIQVHGNKYSYILTEYIHCNMKIKIICNKCNNIFEQLPFNHLYGQGCFKCGINKRSKTQRHTVEQFIENAIKIHFDKYDYSLVDYVNNHVKVKIICRKCNDIFLQKPNCHLCGNGCPKCGLENRSKKRRNTIDYFIFKAKLIHDDLYDYSLINYINAHTKIDILHKECGKLFQQTPHAHLKGQGCSFCYRTISHTYNTFVEQIKIIHSNDEYEYLNFEQEYKNNKSKITIYHKKCNKTFYQRPHDHLNGNGCPYCSGSIISKIETQWLNSLNVKKEHRQYPIKINGKTYKPDGYCPETNTIYEFLGDYWHGNPEKFKLEDLNKRNKKTFGQLFQETMDRIKLFKENGFNVVYIWENDFR